MKTIYIDPNIKQPQIFKDVFLKYKGFNVTFDLKEYLPKTVEIAIIWLEVPSILKEFSNLKLILVCGSGIDQIINSTLIPYSIPLVRLVDFNLRERVANYVLKYVKIHFNNLNEESNSKNISSTSNDVKKTIGIMGLGLVGSAVAKKLNDNSFEVYGWVKTHKKRSIENVFIGYSELNEFAKKCEIIICQLPLTKETEGILNSKLFNNLPKGSYIINVGRGSHLNEDDLMSALQSGQLSGACLDVFNIEPLPENHIFYSNSKITITPHIAGIIDPINQANYAIEIINNFFNSKEVEGIVNYDFKY